MSNYSGKKGKVFNCRLEARDYRSVLRLLDGVLDQTNSKALVTSVGSSDPKGINNCQKGISKGMDEEPHTPCPGQSTLMDQWWTPVLTSLPYWKDLLTSPASHKPDLCQWPSRNHSSAIERNSGSEPKSRETVTFLLNAILWAWWWKQAKLVTPKYPILTLKVNSWMKHSHMNPRRVLVIMKKMMYHFMYSVKDLFFCKQEK